MKRKLVNIGKGMLVVLFLSYYISTTMLYHTHHFYWGTVTHSHPYLPFDNNPANHTHTPIQCQTIGFLSHIVLACFMVAAFIFIPTQITRIYILTYRYKSYSRSIFSQLRAPPVFICK